MSHRVNSIFRRTAILLLLAALSCGKEEAGLSGGGRYAVGFSAGTPGTRAVGEINDMAVDGFSFGVFSYNTGHYRYADNSVNPNFMYNQQVTYSGDKWEYTPVKYWPNGEGEVAPGAITGDQPDYLSFFAYAPYADGTGDTPADFCLASMSTQPEQGNPWIIYRIHTDVAQQVDLLCARPVLDATKPDVGARVHFEFRHALACVGERVLGDCSYDMKSSLSAEARETGQRLQVVLQDVDIVYHLTEHAKLSLWSSDGEVRWSPILNGEITTDRTVTYGSSLDYILYSTSAQDHALSWSSGNDQGVFYIPLDVAGDYQTATLNVRFTIRRYTDEENYVDTPYERQTFFRLSDYPHTFAPGKCLSTISFTINADWLTPR